MVEAALAFPNIDPVIFHIYGPISIRWYALSYIAGLLLGWLYVVKLLRNATLWGGMPFRGQPPATPDDIGDLFVWVTLGVILGGRLGYVLLYGVLYCGFNPDGPACAGLPGAYLSNPMRIFAAWEGGMSFHGGLVAVVFAIWLFCWRRKLKLLAVADLIAAATPIGLFFGRIANFINGELWGKATDVPWGVVFCNDVIRASSGGQCPAGNIPRHPSQLYEAALEGLVLFLVLRLLIVKWQIHQRPGLVVAWFLTGYGAFRFAAEFFRDSESKIAAWFSMGQALSLPMWAAAAFFFWYAFRERRPANP